MPLIWAGLAISAALFLSCLFLLITKWMFDILQRRNEQLLHRYLDLTGRASALIIGTLAVEMILKGVDLWLAESHPEFSG